MRRVHFIGIGGYSMSGLALALHAQGIAVTGSDVRPSARTDRLLAAGVPVAFGHRPENLGDADTVVYTTDVPEDNPERRAARDRGLRLLHRSEILAGLLAGRRTILVTGSHGKTTTTSMIGVVLAHAGWDPLVLVGGEVDAFEGANVRLGSGAWAVAEADESDGSLVRYAPTVAVLTNVEPEHLDHYGGSFERLVATLAGFAAKVPPEGLAVLGIDDPRLRRLAETLTGPVATYGLDTAAEWTARILRRDPFGTAFEAWWQGSPLATVRLRVPGRHNVANALAALAVASFLGIAPETAAAALARFGGAHRRFELLAAQDGILVVDDYAHHPTEIRATLAAARQVSRGRVLAVFQPQRYTRTRQLWDGFVEVLGDADSMLVLDVYAPAGETPDPAVSGRRLAEAAASAHPSRRVRYAPGLPWAVDWLEAHARPGDLVLSMGAGDVWRVTHALAARLKGRRPPV
ncbi:MAG: UDP-N-acetylmuramate--L-alanine ligase [Actinomycetia bacterium]|nr:UDP-N-acetylmuramate--L-alanine ligase [Actinomycetes bacterium]